MKWLPVKGYEGRYEVSDHGEVKSLRRIRNIPGAKHEYFYPERLLKPCEHPRGYLQVYLCKNNFHTKFFIHRLVATHFIPNPTNADQVNHKYGNKYDNRAISLEWMTLAENRDHYENILRGTEYDMAF